MGRIPWRILGVSYDRLLQIGAVVLASLVLATAWHNVSLATDVWYYHMPFATRLAGIVSPELYRFSPLTEEYFATFPLLGELIQGWLWRAFGRAEASNLFSFAPLPLYAWFLQRRFAVPWHLTLLSLLAVPLVHMNASSSLIDLPVGAALAALLLLTIENLTTPKAPSIKLLLGVSGLVGFLVNTKAFAHPFAALCLGALGLRAIWQSRGLPDAERRRYRFALAAGTLLLPILFATPLRNAIVFGNPYFPFQLRLFGHQLPGSQLEIAAMPKYLAESPAPLRFLTSLFELRNLPYEDPARWQPAQFARADSPAYLMGGFFGWFVGFQLSVLLFRTFVNKSREVRVTAAVFGFLTLITSVMPQCHELRYFLYWVILLVSINLWFACKPGAVFIGARTLGLAAVAAVAVVLCVTRGAFTLPTGTTYAQLLKSKVRSATLAAIRDGETVCVMRYPYNILWASELHPGRSYVVQEAFAPVTCVGLKRVSDPPRRRKHRR